MLFRSSNYSLDQSGINLGYSSTYFFFNSAWRKVGANVNSNYNDTVFLPDQYVVIRQNNGADTTQVTAMGQVALSRIRIPLYSNSFGGPKQDNFVGLVRPSNYSLDQSGLTNAFTATTSLGSRNDELLVFDNSVQQKNKGPSATYFYYNNGWRKVGASVSVNFGASNVFQAASGAIVRKQTNSVLTSVWANDPNY